MEIEYSHRFSDDVGSFFRSPVREIFKRVDLNAIYSFAGGYPSADTFPAEAIKQTIADAIDRYGSRVFQYGATQGVPELRKAVAERYGVDEERILISTSSQQGIDVCTRVLVNPGDVILTSAPSYLGAMQSFHSYRATIVGVQHHPDIDVWRQMYVDAIEMCHAQGKHIKFLYMIPDFQNPSGETLTLDERRVLAELAERYDFLIVEDSPYRELRYEGEPVPTLYSLAPERVIHLGSFSKIFAPVSIGLDNCQPRDSRQDICVQTVARPLRSNPRPICGCRISQQRTSGCQPEALHRAISPQTRHHAQPA